MLTVRTTGLGEMFHGIVDMPCPLELSTRHFLAWVHSETTETLESHWHCQRRWWKSNSEQRGIKSGVKTRVSRPIAIKCPKAEAVCDTASHFPPSFPGISRPREPNINPTL